MNNRRRPTDSEVARAIAHNESLREPEPAELSTEEIMGLFNDGDDGCADPNGHSWVYTGTAYGGDDDSYFGEGRCYCEHCGADGDA